MVTWKESMRAKKSLVWSQSERWLQIRKHLGFEIESQSLWLEFLLYVENFWIYTSSSELFLHSGYLQPTAYSASPFECWKCTSNLTFSQENCLQKLLLQHSSHPILSLGLRPKPQSSLPPLCHSSRFSQPGPSYHCFSPGPLPPHTSQGCSHLQHRPKSPAVPSACCSLPSHLWGWQTTSFKQPTSTSSFAVFPWHAPL